MASNLPPELASGWFGQSENFGVPQQQTRVRVVVNSHHDDNDLKGVVDCSDDTVSLQTSKTIKGGGGAQIGLVPRKNYINYIYPDDWINIWVDPGDGRGFIRVFFGFVDRISRSVSTSSDGQTTTQFVVVCSDFTKAFDKTFIYFNPHIGDREDFVGNFSGTKNIAGAVLRTKGVSVFGSPADMVMNLSQLLLGWNAQFMMPKSYPSIGAVQRASREFRRKWIMARLPEDIKKAVGNQTVTDWIKSLEEQSKEVGQWIREDRSVALQALQSIAAYEFVGPAPDQSELQHLAQQKLKKIQDALDTAGGRELGGIYNPESLAQKWILIQREVDPDIPSSMHVKQALRLENSLVGERSLLDLIDFSFIEYGAIDGSIVSTAVWTQQGTLWSIMNSFSNSVINELFCDLRPITVEHKETGLWNDNFLFAPDEHGQVDGAPVSVRFVPAIVMREYPFGTVVDVDLSNIKRFKESRDARARIGEIFAQSPNVGGRKIIAMSPPLNDYGVILHPYGTEASSCIKHLDVHVLRVQDIVAEDIGRSDADTVNLIELYSDGLIGQDMKFMTQDFQPIATPISVMRHGLRVRTYNTKFARFSGKHFGEEEASVDNARTRKKLARWVLLLDHWYQHNIEYLNGSFTTRAFPEIRVGARLDIQERRESYYIEGVNHQWQYPEPMLTTLTVSRGQRNDPFPLYEKPALKALGGDRKLDSRLAQVFPQKDPSAVLRALTGDASRSFIDTGEEDSNFVDFNDLQDYPAHSTIRANMSEFAAAELRREEERAAQAEYNDQAAKFKAALAGIIRGGLPFATPFDTVDIISGLTKSPGDVGDQSVSPYLAPNQKGTSGGGRSQ